MDLLSKPISTEEVWTRLSKMGNTAPGPDGLSYADLKRLYTGAKVLRAVFDFCFRSQKILPQWKESSTVFIYKKGDKNNPENWRPIALGNTIASSNTRAAWNTTEEIESMTEETKRAGREICISWIDLANAFGSVPHHLIFETLEASGIPENYIQIIRDLYKGASTTIRTKNGSTSEIPILCGVKQGCLLSPITFNIYNEPIVWTLEHFGRNLGFKVFDRITTTLAYADDLVITAKNKEAPETLLDTLSDQAAKAGRSRPLLPFRDRAELSKITQAFKMLTSKDANTENLAKIFLKRTVSRKLGRSAIGEDMADYLSGRLDQGFYREGGDVASLWSEARNTTRRLRNTLRARWTWDPDSCTFSVALLDAQSKIRTKIGPSTKHQLIGKLRQALQEYYLETLLLKRDQGKTFEVTCQNQCSNAFIPAGKYFRFADWRFVHRARLNLLPLNRAVKFGTRNKKCRRCGALNETLPHVLQHCRVHSSSDLDNFNPFHDTACKLCQLQVSRVSYLVSKPLCSRTLEKLGRNLGIKVFDRITTTLAYADDLVITARNKEALDTLLDTLSDKAAKARLRMKPQKCATLYLLCRGFTKSRSVSKALQDLETKVKKIDESLLTPWQKIDAIK
ncbi:hypothetical protein LAZ67_3004428 [Cordylochernes scorpioides]|uniref:Reverse transcriptase domain-containing protein n=1 Tax=Cordylochernes scorpioides TaxID=51811 RepID=A0ABY6KE05_9ARAC|nr:hypothetical protein LAZ67_3004428 [Cordylochernes scorpioides]